MEPQNGEILVLGGREYKTVEINNQLWMAENLALLVKDSWFYENNALFGSTYGRLYTWKAAMEACPEGWRLPLVEDWEKLIDFYNGETQAYYALVKGGKSGFDAIYSGYRTLQGDFMSLERAADFWSGSEAGDANAWLFYLIFKKDKVFRIIDDKRCGFSVRYIKDL
ncbi:MAG: FISUMP domain-containing protein [Bacteroidota bacterium]